MSVKLNLSAFDYAKKLIQEGHDKIDERKDWSTDQAFADQENDFIKQHGFAEYGKWYLGVDDDKPVDTKEHYHFPYGNFKTLHRCGLLAAESRAGQYKHLDIENATKELLDMMK